MPQFRMKNKKDWSTERLLDINHKHQTIMLTIPPNDKLKNWMDYELGCYKFFGLDTLRGREIFTMSQLKLGDYLYPRTKDLLLENSCFVFAMSHNDRHYESWKGIFPLGIHIQFINDDEVNRLSLIIKRDTPPLSPGRFSLKKDSYKFDIGTMFNKVSFFNEVSKLLTYLKVDDVSLDDRVNEYYDRYISLYDPYLKTK